MRVLMFGWEFPPFQAGGLATATLGLVKGLLRQEAQVITKSFAGGDVHKYFNPYESPHDAFVACMNVTQDVAQRAAGRSIPAGAEPSGDRATIGSLSCLV